MPIGTPSRSAPTSGATPGTTPTRRPAPRPTPSPLASQAAPSPYAPGGANGFPQRVVDRSDNAPQNGATANPYARSTTPERQPFYPTPTGTPDGSPAPFTRPDRPVSPSPATPGPWSGDYQFGPEGPHNSSQYQNDMAMFQMLLAQYGPQLFSAQSQLSNLAAQLGITNAQYAQNQNDLYAKYGIDSQRLGLASQVNANALSDIGTAKDFTNQWSSLYDAQLANTLAGFGLDRDQIDLAMQGIVNDEIRLMLKSQGLDIDEMLTKDNASRDARAIANEQAAGGAWFSPEHGLARGDVKTDMDAALQQIDLARQGLDVDQSDLDLARKNLEIDLKRVGLSESAARLTRMGQQIQLDEKNANLSQTERDILLAAQELGIDKDELNWKLNSALAQLGWDQQLQLMAAGAQEDELKNIMAVYEQMLTDAYVMIFGEF